MHAGRYTCIYKYVTLLKLQLQDEFFNEYENLGRYRAAPRWLGRFG
jgi:hypothetical protein